MPGARRGQPERGGVEVRRRAGGAAGVPRALPGRARADDDAAVHGRPRGVAAVLPPAARARRGARPARALDGHEPGLPGRRRGGCDASSASDSVLLGRVTFATWASPTSGTRPSSTSASPRRRTGTRTATSPTRTSSAPTPSGRTCAGSRRAADREEFDDWTDPEPRGRARASSARRREPRRAARRREHAERRTSRCTSSCRGASTTRSRSPTGSRKAFR